MTSAYKKLPLVLAAMLALTALAAASASAAEWHLAGSPLTESTPLASTTTSVSGNVLFEDVALTISCKKVTLTNADITAPATGSIEHLVFGECHGEKGECEVKGNTIETKPLKVEAALGSKSPEDTLVLKPMPKTNSVYAEVSITGSRCLVSGTHIWKGYTTFNLTKGREELTEQELSLALNPNNEELADGSTTLRMAGAVKLKLSSGKAWSFH